MKVIAEGKEAVLNHLEQDALSRVGEPGIFMLFEDESGILTAIIAGRTFVGTGTITLPRDQVTTVDGIVVKNEDLP